MNVGYWCYWLLTIDNTAERSNLLHTQGVAGLNPAPPTIPSIHPCKITFPAALCPSSGPVSRCSTSLDNRIQPEITSSRNSQDR